MGKVFNPQKAMDLLWRAGKIFATMLILLCLIGALLMPEAYAMERGQATLTVKQTFTSDGLSVPTVEGFTYRLSAKTEDAPMPEGSDWAGHDFTMRGTEEVQIGPIGFDAPGVYAYTLSCLSQEMPGYTIGRQVYIIEIHVSRDLAATVIIYPDNGVKTSAIQFAHVYGTSECNG